MQIWEWILLGILAVALIGMLNIYLMKGFKIILIVISISILVILITIGITSIIDLIWDKTYLSIAWTFIVELFTS